jgi:phage anti-repressor protein
MQNDLHDKLGLVKKSAKWVSKLMGWTETGENKQLHEVRRCHRLSFHDDVGHRHDDGYDSGVVQNAILKRIEEAKPVAIMAKTHISHTMQMLFEFSERKGLI